MLGSSHAIARNKIFKKLFLKNILAQNSTASLDGTNSAIIHHVDFVKLLQSPFAKNESKIEYATVDLVRKKGSSA